MRLFSRNFLPMFIGLVILIADQASKYFTNAHLPLIQHSTMRYPYGGIGVFKNFMGIEFSISHQINYGAAWGMLANYQVPLLYLRIALIACLCIYALFINKNRPWNIPLAMIIAGAIGNVADYFIYGHVVDMLHFVLWGYDFPVFNIADSAIFLGISSMIIMSFLHNNTSTTYAQ